MSTFERNKNDENMPPLENPFEKRIKQEENTVNTVKKEEEKDKKKKTKTKTKEEEKNITKTKTKTKPDASPFFSKGLEQLKHKVKYGSETALATAEIVAKGAKQIKTWNQQISKAMEDKQPNVETIKREIKQEEILAIAVPPKQLVKISVSTKQKKKEEVVYVPEYGCVQNDQVTNDYVPLATLQPNNPNKFRIHCQKLKKDATPEMYEQAILREIQTSYTKVETTFTHVRKYVDDLSTFIQYYESLAFPEKEKEEGEENILVSLVDQDRRSFERCIKVLEYDLEACKQTDEFHPSLIEKGCTFLDSACLRFLDEFSPLSARIKYIITKLKDDQSFMIPHVPSKGKQNTKRRWWLSFKRRFQRTVTWLKEKTWFPDPTKFFYWCKGAFSLFSVLFSVKDSWNELAPRLQDEKYLEHAATSGMFFLTKVLVFLSANDFMEKITNMFTSTSTSDGVQNRQQLNQRVNESLEAYTSRNSNSVYREFLKQDLQFFLNQETTDASSIHRIFGSKSKFFTFDRNFKEFMKHELLTSSNKQWLILILCFGIQSAMSQFALQGATSVADSLDSSLYNIGGVSGATSMVLWTFVGAATASWFPFVGTYLTWIPAVAYFVVAQYTGNDTWIAKAKKWISGEKTLPKWDLLKWFKSMSSGLTNLFTSEVFVIAIILLLGVCYIVYKMKDIPQALPPLEVRAHESSTTINNMDTLYSTLHHTYLPLKITNKNETTEEQVERQKKLKEYPVGDYAFLHV